MRHRGWAVLVLLALAGCGNDDAAPSASVDIRTFRFVPSPLDAEAGTTVRWTNRDDIEHTVTAGTPASPEDGFDRALTGPGDTFEHTFGEPGTYAYFCRRHPSMTGRVVVS